MINFIKSLFGANTKRTHSLTPPSAEVANRPTALAELGYDTSAPRELSKKDTQMKMARLLKKL